MRRRRIVIITGGVLLLATAVTVGLSVWLAARGAEVDTREEGEGQESGIWAEGEPGEPERTGKPKEPGAEEEPKESETGEKREEPRAEDKPEGSGTAGESEDAEGAGAADSSYYGPLQVVGRNLCDSQGNPVQLKGISTHGLAWFPGYVNEALFQELHEQWNANVIRLAMYTAEYGGYCTGGDKEQLKQLVRDGVEYASRQNMYVIIDWHILSDGNPNTHRAEAEAFFREMSAAFADRENVLYEICNEPNGGTGWSQVKEYAETVIPVIRENDEDAVILIGTPNWSQYVDQAAVDPVTGWENIMYTLHFYAATHRESLRQTMTAALDAGLPIFVSEYSICDASGNGAIDLAQARAWVETMDEYQVSYVAWSLSNKDETSALISSSCNKTSGLSEEDLSDTGKWLYGVLTGGGSQGGTQGSPQGGLQNDSPGSIPGDLAEKLPESEGWAGGETAAAADLNIRLRLSNSWESEGAYFYQYEMTVENLSGRKTDGWSVDVMFQGTPELSDSWNGVFALEGNVLHVSSVAYNGQLESGASAENIGFIVSGGAELSLQ